MSAFGVTESPASFPFPCTCPCPPVCAPPCPLPCCNCPALPSPSVLSPAAIPSIVRFDKDGQPQVLTRGGPPGLGSPPLSGAASSGFVPPLPEVKLQPGRYFVTQSVHSQVVDDPSALPPPALPPGVKHSDVFVEPAQIVHRQRSPSPDPRSKSLGGRPSACLPFHIPFLSPPPLPPPPPQLLGEGDALCGFPGIEGAPITVTTVTTPHQPQGRAGATGAGSHKHGTRRAVTQPAGSGRRGHVPRRDGLVGHELTGGKRGPAPSTQHQNHQQHQQHQQRTSTSAGRGARNGLPAEDQVVQRFQHPSNWRDQTLYPYNTPLLSGVKSSPHVARPVSQSPSPSPNLTPSQFLSQPESRQLADQFVGAGGICSRGRGQARLSRSPSNYRSPGPGVPQGGLTDTPHIGSRLPGQKRRNHSCGAQVAGGLDLQIYPSTSNRSCSPNAFFGQSDDLCQRGQPCYPSSQPYPLRAASPGDPSAAGDPVRIVHCVESSGAVGRNHSPRNVSPRNSCFYRSWQTRTPSLSPAPSRSRTADESPISLIRSGKSFTSQSVIVGQELGLRSSYRSAASLPAKNLYATFRGSKLQGKVPRAESVPASRRSQHSSLKKCLQCVECRPIHTSSNTKRALPTAGRFPTPVGPWNLEVKGKPGEQRTRARPGKSSPSQNRHGGESSKKNVTRGRPFMRRDDRGFERSPATSPAQNAARQRCEAVQACIQLRNFLRSFKSNIQAFRQATHLNAHSLPTWPGWRPSAEVVVQKGDKEALKGQEAGEGEAEKGKEGAKSKENPSTPKRVGSPRGNHKGLSIRSPSCPAVIGPTRPKNQVRSPTRVPNPPAKGTPPSPTQPRRPRARRKRAPCRPCTSPTLPQQNSKLRQEPQPTGASNAIPDATKRKKRRRLRRRPQLQPQQQSKAQSQSQSQSQSQPQPQPQPQLQPQLQSPPQSQSQPQNQLQTLPQPSQLQLQPQIGTPSETLRGQRAHVDLCQWAKNPPSGACAPNTQTSKRPRRATHSPRVWKRAQPPSGGRNPAHNPSSPFWAGRRNTPPLASSPRTPTLGTARHSAGSGRRNFVSTAARNKAVAQSSPQKRNSPPAQAPKGTSTPPPKGTSSPPRCAPCGPQRAAAGSPRLSQPSCPLRAARASNPRSDSARATALSRLRGKSAPPRIVLAGLSRRTAGAATSRNSAPKANTAQPGKPQSPLHTSTSATLLAVEPTLQLKESEAPKPHGRSVLRRRIPGRPLRMPHGGR